MKLKKNKIFGLKFATAQNTITTAMITSQFHHSVEALKFFSG